MSREDFLNPSGEERLLFARFCDLAERAERGHMSFSRFLNLREMEIAKAAVAPYDVICLFKDLFGGNEKLMMGLAPSYMEIEESYFPISRLVIEAGKNEVLQHRDVLGSLTGLGIERNCVGDILIEGNRAFFPVLSSLEDTVRRELVSVGNKKVSVKEYEGGLNLVKNTVDKTHVLSSLRLDCVVSALTGKSRTVASSLIKKGPVLVNDQRKDKLDEPVPLGSLITIRGYGKFKLSSEAVKTSKDKIRIVVSKYI